MPIDAEMLRVAAPLARPLIGTEAFAPLLYALVRMHRPERVVEVGAGYTTLFLAEALRDNAVDADRERRQLREKTAQFSADLGGPDPFTPGADVWRHRQPPFVDPGWYAGPHAPALEVLDSGAHPLNAVEATRGALDARGLDRIATVRQEDWRDGARRMAEESAVLDMVAWDCGDDPVAFFRGFFPLLHPGRGLIVMQASIEESAGAEIEAITKAELAGQVELLHVDEPHKIRQRGCRIIRRIVPRDVASKRSARRPDSDLERARQRTALALLDEAGDGPSEE